MLYTLNWSKKKFSIAECFFRPLSIKSGNIGGLLLNIYGELIGINTAIYAKAQGIGFAIPINKAKRIITDLIKFGELLEAWIGITVQTMDPVLSQYLNLLDDRGIMIKSIMPKNSYGVLVNDVAPNSYLAQLGARAGDIIRKLNNITINTLDDFHKAVVRSREKTSVVMLVQRYEHLYHITIKI